MASMRDFQRRMVILYTHVCAHACAHVCTQALFEAKTRVALMDVSDECREAARQLEELHLITLVPEIYIYFFNKTNILC